MAKIIIIIFLASCSTVTQKLDPQVYYSRDMNLKVNDYEGIGTLVVPKSSQYKIKAKFAGKADLLLLKTCHRETKHEKAGRSERLTYIPNQGIEDKCFLEIAALEHKLGRHSFGHIDFESDQFTLPAQIKCSGSTYNSRGVTVCQSKMGLIQQVKFSEAVKVGTSSCKQMTSTDAHTWRYKTPARVCTYLFKGNSGRLHKLTTIGYERLAIRKLK